MFEGTGCCKHILETCRTQYGRTYANKLDVQVEHFTEIDSPGFECMARLFLVSNTRPGKALSGRTHDQTLSRVKHTTTLDSLRSNTRPAPFLGNPNAENLRVRA